MKKKKRNRTYSVNNKSILSDSTLMSDSKPSKYRQFRLPIKRIELLSPDSKFEDKCNLSQISLGNWKVVESMPNKDNSDIISVTHSSSVTSDRLPSNNHKYGKKCVNNFKEIATQQEPVKNKTPKKKYLSDFVVSDSMYSLNELDSSDVRGLPPKNSSLQSEFLLNAPHKENEYSFSTTMGASSCQSHVKHIRKEESKAKLKLLDTSNDPDLFHEPYNLSKNGDFNDGYISSCSSFDSLFYSNSKINNSKVVKVKNNQTLIKRKRSVDSMTKLSKNNSFPTHNKKFKLFPSKSIKSNEGDSILHQDLDLTPPNVITIKNTIDLNVSFTKNNWTPASMNKSPMSSHNYNAKDVEAKKLSIIDKNNSLLNHISDIKNKRNKNKAYLVKNVNGNNDIFTSEKEEKYNEVNSALKKRKSNKSKEFNVVLHKEIVPKSTFRIELAVQPTNTEKGSKNSIEILNNNSHITRDDILKDSKQDSNKSFSLESDSDETSISFSCEKNKCSNQQNIEKSDLNPLYPRKVVENKEGVSVDSFDEADIQIEQNSISSLISNTNCKFYFEKRNMINQSSFSNGEVKETQFNTKLKKDCNHRNIDYKHSPIITVDTLFETDPHILTESSNSNQESVPLHVNSKICIEADKSEKILDDNKLKLVSTRIDNTLITNLVVPEASIPSKQTTSNVYFQGSNHGSTELSGEAIPDTILTTLKPSKYRKQSDQEIEATSQQSLGCNSVDDLNTSQGSTKSNTPGNNSKLTKKDNVNKTGNKNGNIGNISGSMSTGSEDIVDSKCIDNKIGHLHSFQEKIRDSCPSVIQGNNNINQTPLGSQFKNINCSITHKDTNKTDFPICTSTPNEINRTNKTNSEKNQSKGSSLNKNKKASKNKKENVLTQQVTSMKKTGKQKKSVSNISSTVEKNDESTGTFDKTGNSLSLVDEVMDEIQCQMIASERELERLKNIKIAITWELSKLHAIDSGSEKVTLQNLKAMLGADSTLLDCSRFKKEEEETIKNNWEEFSELYHFENPQLFMGSYQLYGYFSLEERRNFKLFLAKGLPNRRLFSVYRKFRELFGVISKGRWTEKEDRLLIELYNSYDEKKKFGMSRHVMLQKGLGRSWGSIQRRIHLFFPEKTSNSNNREDCIEWTSSLKGKLIYYLLKKLKLQNLDELKDLNIPDECWDKVSVKLRVSTDKVKFHWKYILYAQLFAEKPIARNQLFIDLIAWFSKSNIKRFSRIDWCEVSKQLGNLGSHFLARCFRTMIFTYVPKRLHSNFRGCVHHLSLDLLPKMMKQKKTKMIQRLRYNADKRIVEEIDDRYVIDKNSVDSPSDIDVVENFDEVGCCTDSASSECDSIYDKLNKHPTIDSDSDSK